MLTTISALPAIFDPGAYSTEPEYPEYQLNTVAPISVVRVRLAGEVGIDPVSRERVRVIAEEIAQRTGLQVDITLGSSPTPVTVHYPAGNYGRTDLAVAEPWVQKGVAAVLVQAADRKSVLLSILVLAVCALAVLNANTAAIRARRADFGILACLGWSRRHLAQLMFTEIAGIGLAAGLAGTLLALGFAFALGLSLGAAAGLGAASAFAGGITTALAWCALAALVLGIAVSAVSVVVPIAMLRRLPTAQLLAQG
ncbi:FtsX-like permease family protein [Micromonospora craniellae]|uniref:ABC transporter permease n=1 Tax=Micromonospora craniellae TaxID=2294034 RepID=A0A372G476_9ACTN|nr:FtsX-like permease family protein [Micromonospora craniellae]QOC91970.1 ABC transporter permease [Micromonospora craniellae]RFS47566.1 ABC transporter permease [Micromonospora craniellae]